MTETTICVYRPNYKKIIKEINNVDNQLMYFLYLEPLTQKLKNFVKLVMVEPYGWETHLCGPFEKTDRVVRLLRLLSKKSRYAVDEKKDKKSKKMILKHYICTLIRCNYQAIAYVTNDGVNQYKEIDFHSFIGEVVNVQLMK